MCSNNDIRIPLYVTATFQCFVKVWAEESKGNLTERAWAFGCVTHPANSGGRKKKDNGRLMNLKIAVEEKSCSSGESLVSRAQATT
jgi:hypothetical protein